MIASGVAVARAAYNSCARHDVLNVLPNQNYSSQVHAYYQYEREPFKSK